MESGAEIESIGLSSNLGRSGNLGSLTLVIWLNRNLGSLNPSLSLNVGCMENVRGLNGNLLGVPGSIKIFQHQNPAEIDVGQIDSRLRMFAAGALNKNKFPNLSNHQSEDDV